MNIPPLFPYQQNILKTLLEFTGKRLLVKAETGTGIIYVVREYIKTARLVNNSFTTLLIVRPSMYKQALEFFKGIEGLEVMRDEVNPKISSDTLDKFDLVVSLNLSKMDTPELSNARQINVKYI